MDKEKQPISFRASTKTERQICELSEKWGERTSSVIVRAIQMAHDNISVNIQNEVDTIAATVKEEYDEGELEYPQDKVFEEVDNWCCQNLKHKNINAYTLDDMLDTADMCSAILKHAERQGCIENDTGLWDQVTPYGVIASVAFFSLQLCVLDKLQTLGVGL